MLAAAGNRYGPELSYPGCRCGPDAASHRNCCNDEDERKQPQRIKTGPGRRQQRRRDRTGPAIRGIASGKAGRSAIFSRCGLGFTLLLPDMIAKDHPRSHAEKQDAANRRADRRPSYRAGRTRIRGDREESVCPQGRQRQFIREKEEYAASMLRKMQAVIASTRPNSAE